MRLDEVVECQNADPCLPANYIELNDPRRSTEHTIAYPEEPLCDDELPSGWYRFTGVGGGIIPTTKVDKMKCGTVVPIWMKGELPLVGEGTNGIVIRKACANFETARTDGCPQTVDIGVKNCGSFFTAKNHALLDSGLRMAIFHLAVKLLLWLTDAYPKLTKPPVLSGPETVGKTFRFRCNFQYATQQPQQAFAVEWTFEGVTRYTEVVKDPKRIFYLDGTKLKGNLGKKLGCKVRAFFTNHPQQRKGPWLESNVYWAGIRPEENHLTITEAEELRNVTLSSTVPILCQDTNLGEDESCCVPIDLRVNGPRPDKVQAANSCSWPLCKSRWNDARKEARIPIPLSTSKDKITDAAGTDLLLKFHKLKAAPQHGSYLAVFDDYEISSVQIEVLDAEGKTCSLTSDPHVRGLNRNYFNLYTVGDYTIYQNTDRYFEVQVRTWPCWRESVTCVCGVAVREYDDLIVIDGCDKSYYANGMAAPEIKTRRELRQGVSVMQATDGSRISVYLPSGSEVLVTGRSIRPPDFYYLDVELRVPASDKGHGRGICGTFDDDNTNEFTHRNGYVDTTCRDFDCEFIESWRYDPVHELYFRKFCQCDEDNQRADCTLHSDPVFQCPWCRDRAGVLNANWTPARRRRNVARATEVDVDEKSEIYDPEDYKDFKPKIYTWAMPRNITEAVATRTCRERLEKSVIWPLCNDKEKQEAGTYIGDCIEDVKLGDNFDGVDSMIESFTTACQVELAKDPDNYVTNPETGKSVMKPEISTDICSTICDLHGRCDRGTCVCDQGFTGDNCQLPANQPPILHRVRGSSLCDIASRPCQKIFIDAAYIQMKDTLACKVREVLPDGSVSTKVSMEEAVFLTVSKLSCALPDTNERAVSRFVISVTVDGRVYSNELNVTVYDATCQACTTQRCVKLCYRDGDVNPDSRRQVCDVAASTSRWTSLDAPRVSVNLSGPNRQNLMQCSFRTPAASPSLRYKMAWIVLWNDYPFAWKEQDLPPGTTKAFYNVADLPRTGKLVCSIWVFHVKEPEAGTNSDSNVMDLSVSANFAKAVDEWNSGASAADSVSASVA
ncbi:hypothetical protein BaRGS_00024483 [Batillaria attramentaria]|uniref:VWFD domain-containing protein n=1 Tax=Batillaria attramentaria TaxID=370345 RepID=A0ABD0KAY2_9CAEN